MNLLEFPPTSNTAYPGFNLRDDASRDPRPDGQLQPTSLLRKCHKDAGLQ